MPEPPQYRSPPDEAVRRPPGGLVRGFVLPRHDVKPGSRHRTRPRDEIFPSIRRSTRQEKKNYSSITIHIRMYPGKLPGVGGHAAATRDGTTPPAGAPAQWRRDHVEHALVPLLMFVCLFSFCFNSVPIKTPGSLQFARCTYLGCPSIDNGPDIPPRSRSPREYLQTRASPIAIGPLTSRATKAAQREDSD